MTAVPLASTVSGFFTDEWERLREGTRMLSPDRYRLNQETLGRQVRRPGETRTINVPGWDDIIRLGPRYTPTPEERNAFYAEQRGRGRAQISDEARRALVDRQALINRMRSSATPDFARGIGQILTAIDNVQDMLSTVATFGRLILWTGPRLVTRLSPYLPTLAPLAGRIGARAGAYFIPGLGWIVGGADLLNYLGMLGLISTPIFGLLCAGPSNALAAGLPTWMMRCTLRQEAWRLAHGGPFGRQARADRALRVRGRLPRFTDMIEVAQTTEQLWGYGASFGGIVGLMTESAGAAFAITDGESVSINVTDAARSWNRLLHPVLGSQSAGERALTMQAARIAATAPAIHRTQDHFTDEEHTAVLLSTIVAYGVLQKAWKGLDVQAAMLEALDHEWRVPQHLDPASRELLELPGAAPLEQSAWTLPGAPTTVSGADYIEGFQPLIAKATIDFLEPRRNRPLALAYGTALVEAYETAWLLGTQDPHALHFTRSADAALAISLADSGYLINPEQGEAKLWRFWQAARDRIENKKGRTLYPEDWQHLARQHDVILIPNRGPEGTWPAEWGGAAEPMEEPEPSTATSTTTAPAPRAAAATSQRRAAAPRPDEPTTTAEPVAAPTAQRAPRAPRRAPARRTPTPAPAPQRPRDVTAAELARELRDEQPDFRMPWEGLAQRTPIR